jgi:hypothetical protein
MAHFPDLEIHRLKAGIVLFHPGEDLLDVLPVLNEFLGLPSSVLAHVADEADDGHHLAPEVVQAGAPPGILRLSLRPLLGESGGSPVHVAPQDLGQPFQRQPVTRFSHLSSLKQAAEKGPSAALARSRGAATYA